MSRLKTVQRIQVGTTTQVDQIALLESVVHCFGRVLDQLDEVRVQVAGEDLFELTVLHKLLEFARVAVQLQERLIGDGNLAFDFDVNIVERRLWSELALALVVVHDNPGASVRPLLDQIDPRCQNAPVEVGSRSLW